MTQVDHLIPPSVLSAESAETLYATAYELYRNGKYVDAKGFFRLLSTTHPFDRRFWIGFGACFQMLKQYSQAIECYSVAAVQNPDDPFVHLYAAECFFKNNNKTLAVQTLESSLTVAKKSRDHAALISQLELLRNQWNLQLSGGKHAN